MRREHEVAGTVTLAFLLACDLLGGGAKDPEKAAGEAGGGGGGGGEQAPSPDAEPGEEGGAADDGDVEAVVDGPDVAWHVQLPTVPRSAAITDAGVVLAVDENAVHGFSDGKPAWSMPGAYSELARLSDGTVATTTGATIVAFTPATGEEVFRVDVPAPPGWPTTDRKGQPVPPPAVISSSTFGSQLLVADQEARFFVVDPPACAKQEESCVRPAGALDGEVLEPGTKLIVGADGTRFLIEEDALRMFDQALETLFELEAPGRIIGLAPAGQERLAISTQGRVALMQRNKCVGSELRIPRVATGSKHCFYWIYGDDLDDAPPAVIDEDTIAVNGGRRLQAIAGGDDTWKVPIDSVGRVVVGQNGLLYTMAVADKAAVKAVDPKKATVSWIAELPFGGSPPGDAEGDVVVAENLFIDTRGSWVLAGQDQNVAVVAVPE